MIKELSVSAVETQAMKIILGTKNNDDLAERVMQIDRMINSFGYGSFAKKIRAKVCELLKKGIVE